MSGDQAASNWQYAVGFWNYGPALNCKCANATFTPSQIGGSSDALGNCSHGLAQLEVSASMFSTTLIIQFQNAFSRRA